ncbi:NUDIX hydrolase [Candidatus Formimonas warabiya]|uniref:Nudix hydrolase domain-containing protein n=1 Tax=Formimonas warabiya TaxID=1761012 RepID=A0A3G1KRH6_FORW1|nr:CoA pyrophosphatase [Candidatus Formimonas warabiya]ATW25046.1 hypothetical protein DCMF_09895 [Candidatus Formimonas warabiya]
MKHEDLEKLREKLPAQPGIMGRENFINSGIMILLVLVDGEYHFVFEKRGPSIRQGGEVCFPGGLFDPAQDRDFLDTALRETKEELGIAREKIGVLGRTDTLITPQGVLVEGFVGVGDFDPGEVRVDPREVAYVFTVPVSFLEKVKPEEYQVQVMVHPRGINEAGDEEIFFPAKELHVPEKYDTPWKGRKHRVYVYRYGQEIIWGITAVFIRDFLHKAGSEK